MRGTAGAMLVATVAAAATVTAGCGGSAADPASSHVSVTPRSTATSTSPASPSAVVSLTAEIVQAALAAKLKPLCPHENAQPPTSHAVWCVDDHGNTALVRIYDSRQALLDDLARNPPPPIARRRVVYGPTWIAIANKDRFAKQIAAVIGGNLGTPA